MEVIEKKDNSSTLFYFKLVDYLNPAFNISEGNSDALRHASFTYFNSLILLDGIIDNSISISKLFEATSGLEKSVLQLSSLFPNNHNFWEDFGYYKKLYQSTLKKEKEYSAQKKAFSLSEFEQVAKGKSAVCYALVNAMSYLSIENDKLRDQELIKLLEHIHISYQCKDDTDDFKDDLKNNQYTYAHGLVRKEIARQSKHTNLSNTFLHRYFFVSGIAEKMITKAIKHLKIALEISKSYKLHALTSFINDEIFTSSAQIKEINLLIEKTKVKLELAVFKESSTTKININDSITSAVTFLSGSLDNNNTLSDFMTSAGVGKQWISNYCAFMLAKIEPASDLIKKLSKSLNSALETGSSFNDQIVKDADSLAFGIGANLEVFNKITEDFHKTLWDFQLSSGGWTTYIDKKLLRKQLKLDEKISLNGWTAEHDCVSASLCYILSILPGQEERYFKTAEYLKNQVNTEGCINSYWWSSPIYATAWHILAFSSNELIKSECFESVKWLSDQQYTNGAWKNDFFNVESNFYTAMALQALIAYDKNKYSNQIEKGINYLLNNQSGNGSWESSRILTIPQTDILDKRKIVKWRNSSFGVNIVVEDYKRVFTTATVLKALHSYQIVK